MAGPARPRKGEPIRFIEPTKTRPARYRVILDAGTRPDGQRRQVCSTHPTLSAARAHVAAHKADRQPGVLVAPDRQTFDEAADTWLARRRVREGTLATYRHVLVRPRAAFGKKRLSQITRSDIEAVVNEIAVAGLSKRTATLTLHVLRSIFEDAVDEGYLARNPVKRVEPAGRKAKKRHALTVEEIAVLRRHLSTDRLFACWLLTLYGLRRSEVLGLKWSDVDLTGGRLTIQRSRVSIDGRRAVEEQPKNDKERTLPMPPDLVAALRELRRAQLAEFGAQQVHDGYLAVNEVGEPIRHELWSDEWKRHCKAAGVQAVTLHEARHSSVSAMVEAGVQIPFVAAWHGHSPEVMLKHYFHASEEGMAAAGEALSGLFAEQVS